ncbi:MAG: PQQ-binding-like beta-propeller repeat protein [Gemmataceae bacterium]
MNAWPQWRGPDRDGRVARLPAKLPAKPKVVWRQGLPSPGLGGVAATDRYVVVSARELMDTTDVYICLDASSGKELWRVLNPAPGELDYGNSSRATPLIDGERVFLTGAFGQLHCIELATGKTLWEKDLRDEFKANDKRKWGMCSSPLIVDGRLIVNPGGPNASLVALDPFTGKLLWQSPGRPASYGNFIAAKLGGVYQIVGFDLQTLGGWDAQTGKRLWELKPTRRSDFNVPTPLVEGDDLIVAWENNGTFRYRFGKEGRIDPKPTAHYDRLAPDMHSPVVCAGRLFGVWNGLHALDARTLKPLYLDRSTPFSRYVTLVADDQRVLAITVAGELLLWRAEADKFRSISRLKLFADEAGCYSHPAFVGSRLYVRGERELLAVELEE